MLSDWSRINYQGWYLDQLGWPEPGGDWVIGDWDGYQSIPDAGTGVSPTLVAFNYVNSQGLGMGEAGPNEPQAYMPGLDANTPLLNGVLRITSCGSAWADAGNTGPFLYKMVEGDFVATVQVVSCDNFYNNMGGLMARVPNPGEAGEDENWVYLNYFPVWGVGNNIRNCTNGSSPEIGRHGYPGDPYLKLERVGSDLYFSTSPDGVTYTSLLTELSDPNDPNSAAIPVAITRDDMPAELQVGIFQANFAPDWMSTMDFDNFVIETIPEPSVSLITSVDRSNGTSGDRGFIGVFDGETDPIPMEAGGLMDGAPVFSDRDYTWIDVPAEYVGSEYISTFNTDKDSTSAPDVTYEVTISQPAFVWITIDVDIQDTPHQDIADQATAAFADPGTFVDTGIDLVVRQSPDGSWDRSTNVFGAQLPAGTYVFGQTAIPSSDSFYIIGAMP